MIATGYNLPFRFTHSDGPLSGQPVAIRIRTGAQDTDGRVVGAMRLFARLAMTGALGGDHASPQPSFRIAMQPTSSDQDLRFQVENCRIAAEAWVVLCHLLLKVHQSVPIMAVDVLVQGDTAPVPLMASAELKSTYPGVALMLPFVLDDLEPEGGGYSFFITLKSPLAPDNEATLNAALEVWLQAVLNGGYALAPLDPAACYVEPYGEGVDAYETTIEWAVFKLRADPAGAINGLMNQLARFHFRCQAIHALEIG